MSYFDVDDVVNMKISTVNKESQLWFNRGLLWCFAFNHNEAISCFQESLKFDPDCFMAHWGLAFAYGPNYNLTWSDMPPDMRSEVLQNCFDSIQKAHQMMQSQIKKKENFPKSHEVSLVMALLSRYPQRDPIEDQSVWNDEYANAMRRVYEAHPENLDVVALFGEAIMTRTPWNLWCLKTGKIPKGAGTAEARQVFERAFENDVNAWSHPGILHFYIHLMEMSPFPELALPAGDKLVDLVPGVGHLIHMPTHIDVLCGHYHNAMIRNQAAVKADEIFVKQSTRGESPGFNTLYRAHNCHFVIYGAMFLGQYQPALEAAEKLIQMLPENVLQSDMGDYLESYVAMKQHVFIRFGKWHELTLQEEPKDKELFCVTVAMIRYAKGVAFSALGKIEEAEVMKRLFLEAKAAVKPTRVLSNNVCVDLLNVAEQMLEGELEYRKQNFDLAFSHLRRSVELEDSLPYDEPWGWIQPSRHALGALLSEQGRLEEAEKVYREDLGLGGNLRRACIHPDNIWSLKGLHDCLMKKSGESDKNSEILFIKQRLDLAAARADFSVNASCFCAQKAMANERSKMAKESSCCCSSLETTAQ